MNTNKKYSCIIFGRTNLKTTGLNAVSSVLKEFFEHSGWSVKLISDNYLKNEDIKFNKFDVIFLTGPMSVEKTAFNYLRSKTIIPIISLCLLRNGRGSDKVEAERLRGLSEISDVYFMVWTTYFKQQLGLNNLINIPKPIKNIKLQKVKDYSFEKREGICLGHNLKLISKRFTGRSKYDDLNDIGYILKILKKKYKDIKFYTYGPPASALPGIENYASSLLLCEEFLSKMRLFISLQSNETFYLVPIEAQGVGTPILYRQMPQSLDYYVGHSGLIISDFTDICNYIDKIYYNKQIWSRLSQVSIANYKNLTKQQRGLTSRLIVENFIDKIKINHKKGG